MKLRTLSFFAATAAPLLTLLAVGYLFFKTEIPIIANPGSSHESDAPVNPRSDLVDSDPASQSKLSRSGPAPTPTIDIFRVSQELNKNLRTLNTAVEKLRIRQSAPYRRQCNYLGMLHDRLAQRRSTLLPQISIKSPESGSNISGDIILSRYKQVTDKLKPSPAPKSTQTTDSFETEWKRRSRISHRPTPTPLPTPDRKQLTQESYLLYEQARRVSEIVDQDETVRNLNDQITYLQHRCEDLALTLAGSQSNTNKAALKRYRELRQIQDKEFLEYQRNHGGVQRPIKQ